VDHPAVLTLAAGLVLLAGLFAAVDAALGQVSPTRTAEMAREQVRGAAALHLVVNDAARHVSLLLLLRLACELTATALVGLYFVAQLGAGWAAALVTAASMTVVSFVLVGVGPRTLGRQHAYAVALRTAGVTRWLGRVFGPLTKLLILIGNAVTPGKGMREGPFATEVELREMVDLAEQRGVVERREHRMIQSVFELGDTIVREVMVPRTDVVWIERHKSVRQALALALRSGFSRIPVIGDGVDDVIGVVYLKDLVRSTQDLREGDGADHRRSPGPTVEAVMREAEFVPESKPIDELLREMQARRIHIGIVIDEYGGTAGLVTIEDILEEIVGEITDEYDQERPPVEQLPDGARRVTARLPVEDLGELFDVRMPDTEVETVGGLLAQAIGRVPIPGARGTVAGLELTAEGAAGRRNRIDTVVVRRASPDGARPAEASRGDAQVAIPDRSSQEAEPADA
jgi:CBS domain containing-hemolysin-like protein